MICFLIFYKKSVGLGYFHTISENLKYYFSFQPSVDNTNPNMAHVFVRFPHLAESIFQELDNLSLFNCQIAAKSCRKFIEQSKLYYIRKIKHYTNCKNDTLKKMLHRSDVNAAINLASKVSEFYEKHHRSWRSLQMERELFSILFISETKRDFHQVQYNHFNSI